MTRRSEVRFFRKYDGTYENEYFVDCDAGTIRHVQTWHDADPRADEINEFVSTVADVRKHSAGSEMALALEKIIEEHSNAEN